jgi:PAS domain S-box-containing protein
MLRGFSKVVWLIRVRMRTSQPLGDSSPTELKLARADAWIRAALEQNAAGVVELNAEGRFQRVNRKFCEITGYSEGELLQLGIKDLTHPEDVVENLDLLARLQREGTPYAYEKRYIRKDGTEVWAYVSAAQIGSGANGTFSAVGVVVDLSERRRAEAAAQLSEQSYQTLFNSIDAGFCVIEVIFDAEDRAIDYVFLQTNAVFERVTGLANATGARMRDLAPSHEQHWFDIYGRVARTGEPIRFEQEARALNRWYSVYAFRTGDSGSRKVGILFEDVTARKISEQRRLFLADLADKLAPLRDEAAIVHTTVHALGRFLQVDRCYFVECLEAEDRIAVSENYARPGTASLEGEMTLFEFGGIEWWQKYAAGNFAVNDVTTHPLTSSQNEAYKALGVRAYLVQPFRETGAWTTVLAVTDSKPREWTRDEAKLVEDVTVRVWPMVERARTERALMLAHGELELRVVERTAKLQETISELESYSYSISHDLRAPLRAMQTYASILTSDCGEQLSDDGKEYLRRIMVAAERMDRLIRDVLVFSRVARANMPMERIELGSFISGLIESYPGLSVATAEIEVVAPLGAVRANPAALTQCISNLLGNALKFVASGLKPRIRIWSEAKAQRLRVFIRDNGIGVPPDAHDKIFGMFYQVDQTKEGTGVGLAVVRKAAERMGGTVGVTSAVGQGSTFWLELEQASSPRIR